MVCTSRVNTAIIVTSHKLTSLSALLVLFELVALEKEEREMSTVTAINSDVMPAVGPAHPAPPNAAAWTLS